MIIINKINYINVLQSTDWSPQHLTEKFPEDDSSLLSLNIETAPLLALKPTVLAADCSDWGFYDLSPPLGGILGWVKQLLKIGFGLY